MSGFSERLKQLCADYYYEERDTPPMIASFMPRANALQDGLIGLLISCGMRNFSINRL